MIRMAILALAFMLILVSLCQGQRELSVDAPEQVGICEQVVITTDATPTAQFVIRPIAPRSLIVRQAVVDDRRSIIFSSPCEIQTIELWLVVVDFETQTFMDTDIVIRVGGQSPDEPPDDPPIEPPADTESPLYNITKQALIQITYDGAQQDAYRIADNFRNAVSKINEGEFDTIRTMSLWIAEQNATAIANESHARIWSIVLGALLQRNFVAMGIETPRQAKQHLLAVAKALSEF